MKKILLLAALALSQLAADAQKDYSILVNPFIGTGGHGHSFPGATMPHGMVQLSPDTRLEGWDGCGGYHYSDSFIYGFTHTHLSGTGVSDYGDILLMPMNGRPSPDNKVYGSSFSHSNESARAGYYSVLLNDDQIKAELTASERVGFHKYSFSSAKDNIIVLDLKHRDEVIESSLKVEDSVTVSGLRRSKAWADNQYVFFVIKFSKPIRSFGIWESDKLTAEGTREMSGSKNLKAWFHFDLSELKEIKAKVSISAVDVEGARSNMMSELPGWDFEQAVLDGKNKWNKELAKIEVESTDKSRLSIFYTALYHTAIVPNINMDVDSRYRGRDEKVHEGGSFTNYSVFSLWDTYRGVHPLYTIIDRARSADYIKTFLAQYREGGRLPVWELASCETDCMIGYHSIPVITDAFMKGIDGFDAALALQAMQHSAELDQLGLDAYKANGMITIDDEHENVSKTLEYAYDDWCIAQFAKRISKQSVYEAYIKRAQYYKNVLDTKTSFMRPRKNGDWLIPFDPREVNNNFTEANSWQYSFYMPQDISGYMALTGGRNALEKKLDQLFSAPMQTTGRDQSDITGLIGQYAHGNEPSHHIIYLYNYTNKPYKAQELVHKVLNEFYTNAPDGLIGNEDCGQMSAWYVLSALGFYPVTPAAGVYEIGTPVFSSAVIHLENGRTFKITAAAVAPGNYYVQSAKLNGKALSTLQLSHEAIATGGTLNFSLSGKPNLNFQPSPATTIPVTENIVINPVIHGGGISFKPGKTVTIESQKGTTIYYTMDGSKPGRSSFIYHSPIVIRESTVLKAIAVSKDGRQSLVTTAVYQKRPNQWSIQLKTPYEQQYDGGGAEALIDGLRGTTNWRKGNWQGYQQQDLDVVIDLKKVAPVNKVTIGFLQDAGAWIVMPPTVEVQLSLDGKQFGAPFVYHSDLLIENAAVQLKSAVVPAVGQARFIRVHAKQYGKLPAWHLGAGGNSHIFADEIEIE